MRWTQRLSNYRRALARLQRLVDHDELNEFEQPGLIKAFEFIHEKKSAGSVELNRRRFAPASNHITA